MWHEGGRHARVRDVLALFTCLAAPSLAPGWSRRSRARPRRASLPSSYGVYKKTTMPFKGGKGSITFAIKLERAESRIVSAADIAAFPMEYETFSSGDNKAVLAHHRCARPASPLCAAPLAWSCSARTRRSSSRRASIARARLAPSRR
jgi:hypothetical protein